MPGVGGMAKPGKKRSDSLSGYRQNKMAPKAKKKASMMYEERKASMQPPKSRKQAPQKRTSVRMQQPKFK